MDGQSFCLATFFEFGIANFRQLDGRTINLGIVDLLPHSFQFTRVQAMRGDDFAVETWIVRRMLHEAKQMIVLRSDVSLLRYQPRCVNVFQVKKRHVQGVFKENRY